MDPKLRRGGPPRGPARKPIGEILVAHGAVTAEQLAHSLRARALNGKRLGEVLHAAGVPSEYIARALSEQLGIPLVRLNKEPLDVAVLQMVPEAVARRCQAIPIALRDGRLTVAMVDPLDLQAVDDLERAVRRPIDIAVLPRDDFEGAIAQYPAFDLSVEGTLAELASLHTDATDAALDPFVDLVDDAPIVRFVSQMITQALRQRASDIHIEPQERNLRIRFRIDGMLTTVTTAPQQVQAAVVSRVKVQANMNIAEQRVPQDGQIQLAVDGKGVDIRVSTVPTVYGEKVVMRLLDKSTGMLVLHQLGLAPRDQERLRTVVQRPHGIFLMTGPTGSGKTTTLYALLNMLNAPDRNIITIEDPVEYHIPGITQVQVNPKAGLTFANGLRSFLRQDPDIIMVGEIRDTETAATAVQAALTGHLVLSTLHTNDGPGAVTRLLDMSIEPYLAASTLLGAAAQRLVRVLCRECREPVDLDPGVAARLKLDPRALSGPVYRARGCRVCRQSGYRGRTAIFELMQVDEDMQQCILRRAAEHELRRTASRSGMRDLLEDGAAKVAAGITSPEELLRVLGLAETVSVPDYVVPACG